MTDQELLEKAAKVAGVGPLDFDYAKREGHGFYMGPRLPMPQDVLMAAMYTYWNPLSDDGDALRLAVKLQLDIEFLNGDTLVLSVAQGGGDPYADTRRAIVRAAAKLAAEPALSI